MKRRFAKEFAFILTLIGILIIISTIFHACVSEKTLSVLIETPGEEDITDLETFSSTSTWVFPLLIELTAGFVVASIGIKTLKEW